MKVRNTPPVHLTYCLNVHPGQSWLENLQAVRQYALKVRDQVALGKAFGLGLRLGRSAADELSVPAAAEELKRLLRRENLYVFTINGFAYGRFHGAPVKESVYRPDWRTPERRDYTIILADVLAGLLPEGVSGSISTVPVSYKPWIHSADDVQQLCLMLRQTAEHLAGLRERSGRDISLALEPEPDCYIETTDEAIEFFTGPLAERLPEQHRRHVGVCFDAAHLAVAFEDLPAALEKLAAADVRVSKVHLSSALRLRPTGENLQRLEAFCDEVYLHQVKVRTADGRIVSFRDLPEAIVALAAEPGAEEARVHFHVPLYFQAHQGLESTSPLLTGRFAEMLRAGATSHLEIETYTFAVLPDALKSAEVTESIAREYEWVLGNCLA